MIDTSLSRRTFLQGCAATVLASQTFAQDGAIYPADAFVDSVGVNTHLSSEPYKSRFAKVSELFQNSGIRHLRDELRPDNDLKQWRDLFTRCGIRGHLLVSPATNTATQMLDYLAALGVEKVTAIEGQNEGDSDWFKSHKAARGDWVATVVAYQREIFQALRALYPAEVLPVVSPTVLDWKPGDMRRIRDAAGYCDIVAIHSYAQHREEPETEASYSALSWYLQNIRDGFKPGAPVMATETGYNTTAPAYGGGVSETAASIYILRLLLNNFACGVRRTFLYQFLDGEDPTNWEDNWGLVRHDNTPKPALGAIAALLGGLNDGSRAGHGTKSAVRAAFQEQPSDLRTLQFQRADGSLVIAAWRAARCWDPGSTADIQVAQAPVTLILDRPVANAALMIPNDGEGWTDLPVRNNQIALRVGAQVILVRL